MSSLALCMMVKNEARNLRRCLESVRGHVDRIYITDTGSTDQTIEIAKELGAEIRHFPWQNDFSRARNASIENVSEDWILCLDGDDYFPSGEAGKLRDALRNDSAAMTLDYRVLEGHTPAPGLKLLRNGLGLRFEGIIHENIRRSLARIPEAKISHAKILLEHTGYTPELMQTKRPRNLPLLQREWERSSLENDFRQKLYVGKSLAWQLMDEGSQDEGETLLVALLDEAMQRGDTFRDDWEIALLANLIAYHHGGGREAEAARLCARFEPLFGQHPLFPLYHGLTLFRNRDFPKALANLNEFEDRIRGKPPALAIPEGYLGVDLWELQGHCYFSIGDFENAIRCFSKCMEADPGENFEVKIRLAKRLWENETSAR
jgi:hypothetical protein